MNINKYNRLLNKVASFEKLSLYGNRATFLERLAQDSGETIGWGKEEATSPMETPIPVPDASMQEQPASLTPPPAMNAGGLKEQQKVKTEVKYPSIDPRYQSLLNVKPDGQFGPKTHAALNAYKQKINSPTISDGVALGLLLNETVNAPKPAVQSVPAVPGPDLAPAAKAREEQMQNAGKAPFKS